MVAEQQPLLLLHKKFLSQLIQGQVTQCLHLLMRGGNPFKGYTMGCMHRHCQQDGLLDA